jgi:Glyoxalase superfamily protein
MTIYLPTLEQLKFQARALQKNLAPRQTCSYAQSLEMTAHRYGFKNWNVIATKAPKHINIKSITIGSVVAGQYLGQSFTGIIKTISNYGTLGHYKVTIIFFEPLDVVKFNSFSSLRHRIHCVIDARAISPRRTSDGTPHLILFHFKSACSTSEGWEACGV